MKEVYCKVLPNILTTNTYIYLFACLIIYSFIHSESNVHSQKKGLKAVTGAVYFLIYFFTLFTPKGCILIPIWDIFVPFEKRHHGGRLYPFLRECTLLFTLLFLVGILVQFIFYIHSEIYLQN